MGFGQQACITLSVLVQIFPAVIIKSCQSNDFSLYEIRCTNLYYCKNGTKFPANCPVGKYYDPVFKTCMKDNDTVSPCQNDTFIIEILRLGIPSTTQRPLSRFMPVLRNITKSYLKPKPKTEMISPIATATARRKKSRDANSKNEFVNGISSQAEIKKYSDSMNWYIDPKVDFKMYLKSSTFKMRDMTSMNSYKATSPITPSTNTLRTPKSSKFVNFSDIFSDTDLDQPKPILKLSTSIKPMLHRDFDKTKETPNHKTYIPPTVRNSNSFATLSSNPLFIDMYLPSNLYLTSDLHPNLNRNDSNDNVSRKHRSNKYKVDISFQSTSSSTPDLQGKTIRAFNFFDTYPDSNNDYQYQQILKNFVLKKSTYTNLVQPTTIRTTLKSNKLKLITTPQSSLKSTSTARTVKKLGIDIYEYGDTESDFINYQDSMNSKISKNLRQEKIKSNKTSSLTVKPTIISTVDSNKLPTYMNIYSDSMYVDQNNSMDVEQKHSVYSKKKLSNTEQSTTVLSTPRTTIISTSPVRTTKLSGFMNMYSDLNDLAPSKDMESTQSKYLNPENTTVKSISKATSLKTTLRPYFMNMYEDIIPYKELDHEIISKMEKTTSAPKVILTTIKPTKTIMKYSDIQIPSYMNMYPDRWDTSTKVRNQKSYLINITRKSSTNSSRINYKHAFKPIPEYKTEIISPQIKTTTTRIMKQTQPFNLYSYFESYSNLNQEAKSDLDRFLEEQDFEGVFSNLADIAY